MQNDWNLLLRQRLEALAEPELQRFSSALIPNIPPESVLGVRLPALRRLARELAKGDWRTYLDGAPGDSFEETMLQGMVIGCADMPGGEWFRRIEAFLPKIDNWSVCDSFCAGLKAARQFEREMWDFAGRCLTDEREFTVRFGAVVLLNYYIDEAHSDAALARLDAVRHEGYYAKMAVAWAVSLYFAAFPEQTTAFLRQYALDDMTYRKVLQKILESRQVGAADKAAIRVMRQAAGQRNGGAHQ